MMRRAVSQGSFRHAKDGAAAVEFALLLPLMITMFFGVVETTLALLCRADVSVMASTAADLISQVNARQHRRHQQCLCRRRHHPLSLLRSVRRRHAKPTIRITSVIYDTTSQSHHSRQGGLDLHPDRLGHPDAGSRTWAAP